jgi:hypothetical protein
MLRRFGTGVALASITALVLVGCSPPTPTQTTPPPEPTATPSSEQLIGEARDLFDEYWIEVVAMSSSGSPDASRLGRIATEDVATAAAESVQVSLDGGIVPSAPPEVTYFEALDSPSPTGFEVAVCTDAESTMPVTLDGTAVPIPSGTADIPWILGLSQSNRSEGLWISSLEPADQASGQCG